MVALVVSTIITLLMGAVVVLYAARRAPGTPLTWGEAMIGATWAFAALFLAYGVVPHQWLAYADNELGWRKDILVVGPGEILAKLPFDITKVVLRDIIVVAIYGVFLGAQIFMWAWWQNRGKAKPKAIETSTYGRPLVRKA